MPTSRFYGLPFRHVSQKPWRLQIKPQEIVRGVVRGAAARERLLHPSSAKAAQRRLRVRLVAAYVRRFGMDAFALKFSVPKVEPQRRSNWLSGGYAWWRDRIPGSKLGETP